MIKKYARAVIHDGLDRQMDFNFQFMMGLNKCIMAIDSTPDFRAFKSEVRKIVANVRQVDLAVASALSEYVKTLITDAELIQADFDTWEEGGIDNTGNAVV